MGDRLTIARELPRNTLPRGLERAWSAIWDNFSLLRDLVRYEDIEHTATAGSNEISHGLGRVPRRWSIIRAKDITGWVYETAADSRVLTLSVASVGSDPELVVRVW